MVMQLIFHAAMAWANVSLAGQAFGQSNVNHGRGFFDLSHARGQLMYVRFGDFDRVLALSARIAELKWTASQARLADFSDSDLRKSSFIDSAFAKAIFRRADLRSTVFQRVTLASCVFDGADLRGAKFNESALTDCSFAGAKFNGESELPFGRNQAEEMGMIYVH